MSLDEEISAYEQVRRVSLCCCSAPRNEHVDVMFVSWGVVGCRWRAVEQVVDWLVVMGLLSLVGGGTLILAWFRTPQLQAHPGCVRPFFCIIYPFYGPLSDPCGRVVSPWPLLGGFAAVWPGTDGTGSSSSR